MAGKKKSKTTKQAASSDAKELPLQAPAVAADQKKAEASVPPVAAKAAKAPATKKSSSKSGAKSASARPQPAGPTDTFSYSVKVDFDAAGRDAIDTYVACGAAAAKGMEILAKEMVGFSRAAAEAQFALANALLKAKSLDDTLAAQRAFAEDSVSSLSTNLTKLTGLSAELTQDVIAPVQERVSAATRTIWHPLAA
jgi:phasin family protein